MSKPISEEIGKIYRIRKKTFGEKVGDFIKGVFVALFWFFVVMVIIGLIVGDSKAETTAYTPPPFKIRSV